MHPRDLSSPANEQNQSSEIDNLLQTRLFSYVSRLEIARAQTQEPQMKRAAGATKRRTKRRRPMTWRAGSCRWKRMVCFTCFFLLVCYLLPLYPACCFLSCTAILNVAGSPLLLPVTSCYIQVHGVGKIIIIYHHHHIIKEIHTLPSWNTPQLPSTHTAYTPWQLQGSSATGWASLYDDTNISLNFIGFLNW